MNKTISVVIVSAVLLAGCWAEQKQMMHTLENPGPVNCDTAEGDIRVLESEKAHVAQRVIAGATAVTPAGAALGILTGTEATKLKIAVGVYNEMLDDRIAEIESTCGIR